jgi:hypothetical protein
MFLLLALPLFAAPRSAPALVDALGAWHTRYAILGTTGTYDFFRTRPACVLGVPRDGGPTVHRCGGNAVPDAGQTPPADLDAVLERAAQDARYDWVAAGTSTADWVGAWREATLVELVPTPTEGAPGGLAAAGAAAWDGASGVYGWTVAQVPKMDAARWIDWRPPADLDGTFVTLSARSDPRYSAPSAALNEAIVEAVGRHLRGESLPTGLYEVPGGPLYTLPATRLAFEWVVFMESDLAGELELPWDFRELDVPVALISDPVRYEYRLPGSRAHLLVTLSRYGATFEIGAPGPPCEPWASERACQRPPDSVEQLSGSFTLPLRREGDRAAIDGPFEFEGATPDSALGATHGVDRRQWIVTTQVEPSRRAWRGDYPILVVGPSAPPPPPAPPPAPPGSTAGALPSNRTWRYLPPPPKEPFDAPFAATLTGSDGRWRVRGAPSAFPLELEVKADQPVTLEIVAFYGLSPPFPHDAAPGPAQIVDARAEEGWSWTFSGERPT